jgi:hypothetical protein
MVNAESVTDQEMIGLNALDVLHCCVVRPHLHQHDRSKEGEAHCRSGPRRQALVARKRRVLRVEREPDRPLEQCLDEPPHHGEHSSRGHPLRLLPPYWGDRRRGLDPAESRLYWTLLVMLGL